VDCLVIIIKSVRKVVQAFFSNIKTHKGVYMQLLLNPGILILLGIISIMLVGIAVLSQMDDPQTQED